MLGTRQCKHSIGHISVKQPCGGGSERGKQEQAANSYVGKISEMTVDNFGENSIGCIRVMRPLLLLNRVWQSRTIRGWSRWTGLRRAVNTTVSTPHRANPCKQPCGGGSECGKAEQAANGHVGRISESTVDNFGEESDRLHQCHANLAAAESSLAKQDHQRLVTSDRSP